MNTPQEQAQAVREQARKIAASGDDIRRRIEKLVQQMAKEIKSGTTRLVDVAQEVLDGAAQGIRDTAPPDDQQSRLRQVIDGLGDGFTKAANATRLAIEEAASRGEHFAKQDVTAMFDDMRSLRDMFVDVVTRTASRATTTAKNEVQDTTAHVKRTFESLKPSLDKALNAAKEDPAGLGKETAEAIGQASRQAAGALFAAVGDLMQHAANRLDPKHGKNADAKSSASANPVDGDAADVQGGDKI